MKKLALVLALVAAPSWAQFSTRGTQSYRNALTSNNEFGIPRFTTTLLPTCAANNLGALAWDTTTSSTKICNGTTWAAVSAAPAIDACPQTTAHSICKGDSTLVFEGATADDFETTLTVTDPDVDSTFTIGYSPDGNPWIGATAGDSATSDDVDNVFLGQGAGTAAGAASAATDNVAIGDFAGDALTSGTNNIAIGSGSDAGTTGDYNTCVGAASCPNVLATDGSTVIGYGADAVAANSVSIGRAAISGAAGSITIGYQAGAGQLSTSANNTLVGYQAGMAIDNADGDDNTFLGYQAGLASNAVSADNTCVGKSACDSITTGDRNTIVGNDADGLAAGTDQTALGDLATVFANGGIAIGSGAENSDGVSIGTAAGDASAAADVDNVFIGTNAGTAANGTSTDHVFIGDNAGDGVTTGDGSVIIGADADQVTSTQSNLVAIGLGAVAGDVGGISIGYESGANLPAGADSNTFLGYQAGKGGVVTNAADGNTLVGYQAGGAAQTTAALNVAVGSNALDAVTTAGAVVAVGAQAFGAKQTGNNSVAVGYAAGATITATGGQNVFIGNTSDGGTNTTRGVAVGYTALVHDDSVAIGHTAENYGGGVSIGKGAGDAQSSASDADNVFIGMDAGGAANGTSTDNTYVGDLSGDTTTTGDRNALFGANTDVGTNTDSDVTAIGEGMVGKSSDSLLIGFGGAEYSYTHGAGKVITDNTATAILDIAVADDTAGGATIEYTITAIEADEYQSERGAVYMAWENDSGTESCAIGEIGTTVLAGGGTMAVTNACTVGLTDEVRWTLTADSSLGAPASTVTVYYSIRIDGPATNVTPQ